ncbi:MAG: prepilin-type N-terminal cleavage/methylation domain-containing protein [Rickettsiales bacterium]|nr:prepilin-type N-terminal cleavage/methylation domain-containing protein [Rickettsiales bacterium]
MQTHSKSGFSLVELSVVLIIIGLIAGGIVAGQSLIRNAEISSVIGELAEYSQASDTFYAKYGQLAGDMSDASSYWPSCDPTPANCDGNGDGAIDDTLPWVHLSSANLVAGSYPIIAATPVPGVDIPESSIKNAVFGLTYGFPYGKLGNHFTLSKSRSDSSLEGAVNASEALSIDKKIDDGLASYGEVFAINQMNTSGTWQTTGCVTGGDLLSAPAVIDWQLSNEDTEECVMVFYID